MHYLEKEKMKPLLAAPNRRDAQGFRDYALLLFLYNTGARVSEASRLTVEDLAWYSPWPPSTVKDAKCAGAH
jgi:integrase/recombinase XerD